METAIAPPRSLTGAVTTLPATNYRIGAIDLLRGLVMIIMALDHSRDFFHLGAFTSNPMDLQTTTPLLFFTRFITHYCAPTFVFLAGTSAYLQGLRKPKKELGLFLIKRGLWLVIVEVIIMSFAISFDPGFHFIFLQTIWAIGISMIVLGAAIQLPFAVVAATGLLIVLGHNALDYYEATHQGDFSLFYMILHKGGFTSVSKDHFVGILYPVLPWIGLMLAGYCFGRLYIAVSGGHRRKMLVALGTALIVFFIALRFFNGYGDPGTWSAQKNTLFTLFDFIDVQKYPPSLLFMCVTIGPALLFLAFADNARSKLAAVITVYGRVPFLYYVLHFFVLHALSAILYFSRGHSFAEGMNNDLPFKFTAKDEGYSLAVVYLVWILVVASLYPVCKWFAGYKQRHKKWWLSYL